jgi:hypothetical protein
LELVERAADGSDIPNKLRRASADLKDVLNRLEHVHGEFGFVTESQWLPIRAVGYLLDDEGLAPTSRIWYVLDNITEFVREWSLFPYQQRDVVAEQDMQCRLLWDIFGNPFRPAAVDPRWRTSTVLALADGIYADRAFDRLPILADALEEAGCDSEAILAHCRDDGPHVRGCWVVDLLLGKE